MRLSLRWKLVLGSLLVEIVMLSFLVANSLRLNQEHMQQLVDLRLKEVSVLLNASIAPAMVQEDYPAINNVFRASRNQDGIVYFLLYDSHQRLIAADGWDGPAPTVLTQLDIPKSATRIDAHVPVSLNGVPYGELRFGVNTQFVKVPVIAYLTSRFSFLLPKYYYPFCLLHFWGRGLHVISNGWKSLPTRFLVVNTICVLRIPVMMRWGRLDERSISWESNWRMTFWH